ncbi:hypothetical protein ACHFCA_35775 (plasmid) [Delftia tsuruhatensis]
MLRLHLHQTRYAQISPQGSIGTAQLHAFVMNDELLGLIARIFAQLLQTCLQQAAAPLQRLHHPSGQLLRSHQLLIFLVAALWPYRYLVAFQAVLHQADFILGLLQLSNHLTLLLYLGQGLCLCLWPGPQQSQKQEQDLHT